MAQSARARAYEALAVTGVLALAAWLRMGWPGIHSFSFDEARVSLMSLEMARQGQFARLGMISSTGIPNLPGAIWLFAVPFRLTSDPLWVSLGVGLLGVLAVAGVWWLARRAWGAWAALGAALAFAASPYAVFYARGIWGQDLLPPLAVLWAMVGVYGIARGKWWALALHVFLAGFAFQVHYAGITLIPATLWLILRFRLWRRWPSLLLGGMAALCCAWPYVQTLWCCAPQVRAAWEALLHQPSQTDFTAWRQFVEMAVGANWEWLPLGPQWRWPQGWGLAMGAANVILGALMLGGLIASLASLWRDRKSAADERVVLAALWPVWALAGPLAFTRHSSPAYHQYQLAALPAAFLALGAGLRVLVTLSGAKSPVSSRNEMLRQSTPTQELEFCHSERSEESRSNVERDASQSTLSMTVRALAHAARRHGVSQHDNPVTLSGAKSHVLSDNEMLRQRTPQHDNSVTLSKAENSDAVNGIHRLKLTDDVAQRQAGRSFSDAEFHSAEFHSAGLPLSCLAALLLAASLIQTASYSQALNAIAVRLTPGGLGTPLRYPREAARALQDGGRVVVHAHGDQADVDGDAAAFRVLLWEYPAQIVDGRSALLIPAADADHPPDGVHPPHLLMTFADLPAWGELAASGIAGTEQTFPRREGEPPFMAFTVQGANTDRFEPLAPLTLANGAQLLGYRARVVGDKWRVSCLWRIVGPLPAGRYHQFNHLRISADGEPLAIRDAPVSSAAWQVGDMLVAWADFDRPAEAVPFWLDVGMYSYPKMERSAVLGRDGDPLAPIRLGPFVLDGGL